MLIGIGINYTTTYIQGRNFMKISISLIYNVEKQPREYMKATGNTFIIKVIQFSKKYLHH